MMRQNVWHGNEVEALDLQKILNSNCTCEEKPTGKTMCAGHYALVHDQRFINGLVWARRTRAMLCREEGVDV